MASTQTATYHIYAEDGFESAHRSERSARAAARRGSRLRQMVYQIVVPTHGYTGGGHGRVIAVYRRGAEEA